MESKGLETAVAEEVIHGVITAGQSNSPDSYLHEMCDGAASCQAE